jgi:hypothetical protein
MWVAQADDALGVSAALAAQIPEWRRGPVRHSRRTLVRQRVRQIACGYEDQDDADTLRTDPLLQLACGRAPESGTDLASQPTRSRRENAVGGRTCYRLGQARLAIYLQERERRADGQAAGGRTGGGRTDRRQADGQAAGGRTGADPRAAGPGRHRRPDAW